MTDNPTICAKCSFCIRKERPSSPRYDAWYNFVCGAVENEKILNFLTGKMEYSGGEKHPNCRYVNTDGNCQHFIKLTALGAITGGKR